MRWVGRYLPPQAPAGPAPPDHAWHGRGGLAPVLRS